MINIATKGLDHVVKEIKTMDKKADKVVQSTVNEFKSRGKAWVNKAVSEHYNITSAKIKANTSISAKGGKTVKVAGRNVGDVSLVYKGGLSSIHSKSFGMKPTKPPTPRKSPQGGKRKSARKPYQVTATIKKGRTAALPDDVFLASSNGGAVMPFQRKGSARLPIKAIKTLSVPQMISNEQVAEDISKAIMDGIEPRLEHHVRRQFGAR